MRALREEWAGGARQGRQDYRVSLEGFIVQFGPRIRLDVSLRTRHPRGRRVRRVEHLRRMSVSRHGLAHASHDQTHWEFSHDHAHDSDARQRLRGVAHESKCAAKYRFQRLCRAGGHWFGQIPRRGLLWRKFRWYPLPRGQCIWGSLPNVGAAHCNFLSSRWGL